METTLPAGVVAGLRQSVAVQHRHDQSIHRIPGAGRAAPASSITMESRRLLRCDRTGRSTWTCISPAKHNERDRHRRPRRRNLFPVLDIAPRRNVESPRAAALVGARRAGEHTEQRPRACAIIYRQYVSCSSRRNRRLWHMRDEDAAAGISRSNRRFGGHSQRPGGADVLRTARGVTNAPGVVVRYLDEALLVL